MHTLHLTSKKPLFGRRQYRWKIKAGNGRTIAASSESYNNKMDCIDNLLDVKKALVSKVLAKSSLSFDFEKER